MYVEELGRIGVAVNRGLKSLQPRMFISGWHIHKNDISISRMGRKTKGFMRSQTLNGHFDFVMTSYGNQCQMNNLYASNSGRTGANEKKTPYDH